MIINIFGIPSNAGALYEGTDLAPKAIREAGLEKALVDKGMRVEDYGDLIAYSTLPRHNIGPVRNWPTPRIVWESTVEKADVLFQEDSFTIILGGDCSMEVGTFTAFRKVFGENSYLLVLDGHVDTTAPKGDHCVGAAGMGLWFLTQDEQVWWKENSVPTELITVVGVHTFSENHFGIKVVPHEEVEKIDEVLKGIPYDANILVHFDVDVLHKSVMPAAYAPSNTGLDFEQASSLVSAILADPRVKGIEVTEFSANKDTDGSSAKIIVELLSLIG